MTRYLKTAALIFGLAVLYFCAGSFGLSLARVHPSASAVWPPSGIALAALLLWGYRLWPGVFVGAFLVNIAAAQGSLATPLTIAAGNTLEAILGVLLVRRFANGIHAFDQTKTIIKFFLLAGILPTAAGATIGVTSLTLSGLAPWDTFLTIWLTWWLGDGVGNLIVAPAIILWVTQPLLPVRPAQLLEAAGLVLGLVLVGGIIFLTKIPAGLEYFALVPILWGALRFGRRGAVSSVFVMSAIALWGTVHSLGPFSTSSSNQPLLLLQVFMATVTVTALVMASVISERRRLEQRLRIKDAVSRILAESPGVNDAAVKIIQVICETAEWELGAIWEVDRFSQQLTCLDFWSLPTADVAEFEAITRRSTFRPGVGLPGRVWKNGNPSWIIDVTSDDNFPRAPVAAKDGIRAGIGFPIKLAAEVVGVMECFSREILDPDQEFLDMGVNIGNQLGQFIERKRAEDALRESESQLQVAMSAGQMGAWQWDLASGRITWSPGLEAIHGLPPGTFGGTFEAFKSDIHPDDLQLVLSQVEKALASAGDFHVTYRIRRPDGLVRWVEGCGQLFLGGNGQPEKLAGICMDITDRKQTEEVLRQRTRSLEIVNQMGNALAGQLDLGKIVQMVTDAGREVSGAQFGAFFYNTKDEGGENYAVYAVSGVARNVFDRFATPRNTHLFGTIFQKRGALRIGDVRRAPRYDATLSHDEASDESLTVRSYLAVPVVSRSDEILGGLFLAHPELDAFTDEAENIVTAMAAQASIAIDNANLYQTVQRHAEESRILIDTAPIGIAVATDPGCEYIWCNPELARMLGTDSAQDVSKSGPTAEKLPFRVLRNGQPVAAEDLPMQRACRDGVDILDEELEVLRNDGTIIHELCRATPLRDETGKVRGCIGIFLNMTDRKEAEAALQQAKDELARANQELDERVQYRTAELQLANAALSKEREEEKRLEQQLRQAQKMESIGTLAGGIAHDFNNILNIIRGYASLLRTERPGDEELSANLDVIDEAVERGASTVRQLLAVGKESAVRFEHVDLNDALRKLKGLLSGTFPKTIAIGLDLEPGLSSVMADPNQIDQVLLNICVNARDAMPEGGELLLQTGTAGSVELGGNFHLAKAYACISVKDTGLGMDDGVKSRIFEPFFTTKGQGQGTGLGLSVAYGIVTNHGGFIDVTSDPGHGTTFRIYLPLLDGEDEVAGLKLPFGSQVLPRAAVDGQVVLFVEDEIRQLELMRKNLEKAGYRVLVATDGIEAVETFLRHKDEISVVVLDLGLPKLNGWEAFQKMRKADPMLKPILASGYISQEMESAMAEGKLSALLMKPYGPNEILEQISLALLKTARTLTVPESVEHR